MADVSQITRELTAGEADAVTGGLDICRIMNSGYAWGASILAGAVGGAAVGASVGVAVGNSLADDCM